MYLPPSSSGLGRHVLNVKIAGSTPAGGTFFSLRTMHKDFGDIHKGKVSSTPTVLLMDIGNVVLAADHNITYRQLIKLGVPPEKVKLFFAIPEYKIFSRGKIDAHAYAEALRTFLEVNLTDDQLQAAHDAHNTEVIPGMKDLLAKLTKQYGTSFIVFVTDTNMWQTARQQELIDLSAYRVITSDEVGMLKADPQIIDTQGNPRSFFCQC